MNETLDTYYGYLLDKSDVSVSNKDEIITIYRYFTDPKSYQYKEDLANTPMKSYELIFNNSIGYADNEIKADNGDYTKLYADLFYGIIKMRTDAVWTADPNIKDQNYPDQDVRKKFSNILLDVKGCIQFVYTPDSANKVSKKYYIYYDIKSFEDNYALPESYYVFYDDAETVINADINGYPEGCPSGESSGQTRVRNTIESVDVFGVLQKFARDLGTNNIYKNVTCYHYNGSTCYYDLDGKIQYKNIHQDFYVFYTRLAPNTDAMKNIIQSQLIIDKGSRDLAAFAYPDLFEDEIRSIYMLETNRCFPVSYNKINEFLAEHKGFKNPEIISVLQLTCPLIVENGVSDVIEAYSPIEINDPQTEGQIEANKFLFYLSSIVNYINGSNLDPAFYEESGFKDCLEYGYVEFKFQFVTWRVYKN